MSMNGHQALMLDGREVQNVGGMWSSLSRSIGNFFSGGAAEETSESENFYSLGESPLGEEDYQYCADLTGKGLGALLYIAKDENVSPEEIENEIDRAEEGIDRALAVKRLIVQRRRGVAAATTTETVEPAVAAATTTETVQPPRGCLACCGFSQECCYKKLLLLFNKFICITRAYIFGIGTIFMFSHLVGMTISICHAGWSSSQDEMQMQHWLHFASFPIVVVVYSVIIDQTLDLLMDSIVSKVPFAELRGRMMACYVIFYRVANEWFLSRQVESDWRPTQWSWWFVDFVFVCICDAIPLVVSAIYSLSREAGWYYRGFWDGLLWSSLVLVIVYLGCDIIITFTASLAEHQDDDSHWVVNPSVFKKCMEQRKLMVGWMGNLGWFMLMMTARSLMICPGCSIYSIVVSLVFACMLFGLSIVVCRYERKHELCWSFEWRCQGFSCDSFLNGIHRLPWVADQNLVWRDAHQSLEWTYIQPQPASQRDGVHVCKHCCDFKIGRRFWRLILLCIVLTIMWICVGVIFLYYSDSFSEVKLIAMTSFGLLLIAIYGLTYSASRRQKTHHHFLGVPFCASLTVSISAVFIFSILLRVQNITFVDPKDVTALINTTERLYFETSSDAINPVCQLGYGENYQLSAVDMGIMSRYVYAVDNSNMSAERVIQQETWVRGLLNETFGKDDPADDKTFHISHLNTTPCDQENLLHVDIGKTTVVAIRGTSNVHDLSVDAAAFTTSAMLQIASGVLVPVIGLLPTSLVSLVLQQSTPDAIRGCFKKMKSCVEQIKKDSENRSQKHVVITGHSLGGLIAEAIGVELELQTIVFSAPGFERMRHALGIEDNDAKTKRYSVIVPERDPVPMVDAHPGVVHTIPCDAPLDHNILIMNTNIAPGCHSMERTVCQLEDLCGREKEKHSYKACQIVKAADDKR